MYGVHLIFHLIIKPWNSFYLYFKSFVLWRSKTISYFHFLFQFIGLGKPQKKLFFLVARRRGGCKGRATKKNELFLKLEKNQVKNVATKKILFRRLPLLVEIRYDLKITKLKVPAIFICIFFIIILFLNVIYQHNKFKQ